MEGIEVRRWWRGQKEAAAEALADCQVCWVLVSDSAIEPFIEGADFDCTFLHAAGGLVTSLAHGMHPLCTFGPEPYEIEVYRQIPFVCDASGPAFSELHPGLPNPSYRIRDEDRPLYHAACVLGGNGSTLLWLAFLEVLERLGIPREAGIPYLERVGANVARLGPDALTGPLARGDRETVRANLEALRGEGMADVYRSLARMAAPDLLENGE
jgi:predicted short-subunit dehydrogenase-like oxidoreductase (DUF2520 family)